MLIQLVSNPMATSPRRTAVRQADSHYQKTVLWLREQLSRGITLHVLAIAGCLMRLREQLSRGITLRHHHFPQLQGEDRMNLLHSLLLAQRAADSHKPAAYQTAIDNALDICRQAGADSLLNQLQNLAELELSPPYAGKAIRHFIELRGQAGK